MRMIHRVKAPIQPLVNQMLDQLPESVWISDSTTFLDPALGGGQFIREIEKRLRAAGHSDQNIASRVWGCESLNIRLKYVKNWHKVVTSNLVLTDFVSYDWGNMKFDVIIGNPPYQSEKGTGTQPLWPLFVHKASMLLAPDGHMAMITPNKWCGHTTNVIKGGVHLYGDIFRGKMFACDIQRCSTHFPGVGGYENCFSWFMISNAGSSTFKATTLTDQYVVDAQWFDHLPLRSLNEVTSSIIRKTKTPDSFQFKQVSTGFVNQNNGAVVISMAQRMHYNKLNIYWDHKSSIKPTSKSTVSQVTFKRSSQKKVDAVFKSKLFKFLYAIYWNNDNFSTSFYNSLPLVDLNKLWQDQDLFMMFKLSQPEIEYIESYLAEQGS